jgi:peroxiredoxin
MSLLSPGDAFPSISLQQSGGGSFTIPDVFGDGFGVVLINRGRWCPYCNGQLRSFQRATDKLAEVGAKVVSFSVDDEATTAGMVAENGLTFPVGYGVDTKEIASSTGAFVDPEGGFLQSTGFVLDPSGRVVISVYSSGPIGRLVPDDVVGLIRYVRDHAASA